MTAVNKPKTSCDQCEHDWDIHTLSGFKGPGEIPLGGFTKCPVEGCPCSGTWDMDPVGLEGIKKFNENVRNQRYLEQLQSLPPPDISVFKGKKILITGAAGSGKSFFQKHLTSLGLHAVDSDEVLGLSTWVDEAGKKVDFPKDAGDDWLKRHHYSWDKEVLKTELQKSPSMVLLGLSDDDAIKFKDLFDVIAYLQVPMELLEDRLSSRKNWFGRTIEQRMQVVSYLDAFDQKAIDNGYVILDASKPPALILEQLIQVLQSP